MLEKIDNSINPHILKGGSLSHAFTALKGNNRQRIEQAQGFVSSVKTEILDILTPVYKEQAKESKLLSQEGRKLVRGLKAKKENLLTHENKYKKKNEELENIEKSISDPKGNNIASLRSKYQAILKQVDDFEAQYKYEIDVYNSYLKNYFSQMNTILATYQVYEETRIEKIKDSAMKFFVFDISVIRNLQYDLERLSKKIEIVDKKQDIIDYVTQIKNDEPIPEKQSFKPYKKQSDFMTNEESSKDAQAIFERFLPIFSEYIRCKEQNIPIPSISLESMNIQNSIILEKCLEITKIVISSWYGSQDETDLKKFAHYIKNIVCREFAIKCFNSFRLSGKFVLFEQGYDNLTALFIILLDMSQIEKDLDIPLQIMHMSITYFKKKVVMKSNQTDIKEEKIFLQEGINEHPIWKTEDYWDNAILNEIKKEFASNTFLEEKTIVFNTLVQFLKNMLLFSISPDDIISIIEKFCKNFKLAEIQFKDIKVKFYFIQNLIDNYETNGFTLHNFKSLDMVNLNSKEKNKLVKVSEKNVIDKTVFVKSRKVTFQPLNSNIEESKKDDIFFETEDFLTKKDVFD